MAADIHANAITDIYERLTALESQVTNLLLDATVTKVHADKNLVDVDVNGLPLEELPYLTQRAGDGKTYWMPSVGESGMLLVPSGDVGNARFLPAQTTNANPAPEKDAQKYVREWKVGAKETFDGRKSTHELLVQDAKRKTTPTLIEDSLGAIKIEITPFGVKITAPIVNVVGILQVGGVPLIVP